MKAVYVYIVLLVHCFHLRAQDIHFSQFYNTPLNLNPAHTGFFDGTLRAFIHYKDQWSAVTVPYRTFSAALDVHPIKKMQALSVGFILNQDRAGDSRLNTFQMNPSVGYRLSFGEAKKFYIQPGIQLGIQNKTIDYDDLYFEEQWNGSAINTNISNGENFQRSSRWYANLGVGILGRYKIAERKYYDFGMSMFNLTKPQQSYFNNDEIVLDTRLNIHAEVNYPIHEKWDVIPRLRFMRQGKHQELIIGSAACYYMDMKNGEEIKLYPGVWYRTGDALYISAGAGYQNWHFEISYDVNLSSLQVASNNRGGIELSLRYIFEKYQMDRKQRRICPNYL